MQQTTGIPSETKPFDVAKVIELKRGDGCWFEKETGDIVLLRGTGMHPMQKLVRILGLEGCCQTAEELRVQLQSLFWSLNLNLSVSLSDERPHGAYFTFA